MKVDMDNNVLGKNGTCPPTLTGEKGQKFG